MSSTIQSWTDPATGDQALVVVDAHGLVTCTAEALGAMLERAGFQRNEDPKEAE